MMSMGVLIAALLGTLPAQEPTEKEVLADLLRLADADPPVRRAAEEALLKLDARWLPVLNKHLAASSDSDVVARLKEIIARIEERLVQQALELGGVKIRLDSADLWRDFMPPRRRDTPDGGSALMAAIQVTVENTTSAKVRIAFPAASVRAEGKEHGVQLGPDFSRPVAGGPTFELAPGEKKTLGIRGDYGPTLKPGTKTTFLLQVQVGTDSGKVGLRSRSIGSSH